MARYSTKFAGVGGKIKIIPEDFIVTELTENGIPATEEKLHEQGGLYLHVLVKKKNMDHHTMTKHLTRFFSVREEDIGTAGIKDKKAITYQVASIFNPKKNMRFSYAKPISHLEIWNLGKRKKGIVKGHLKGNAFEIKIRDVDFVANENEIKESLQTNKIFNYYGHQRFGCLRPINPLVGYAILKKEHRKAIDLIIGTEWLDDRDENKFRRIWNEDNNAQKILDEWSNPPLHEKLILQWLSKRPNDYSGAVSRLPKNLINLFKRSFISLLWNKYLSKRGNHENPLSGERTCKTINGKNLEIALPSKEWSRPLNEIWKEVFEEYKIDMKVFSNEKHSSRLAYLDISNLEIILGNEMMSLKFKLSKGQYATILLREVMKTDFKNYC